VVAEVGRHGIDARVRLGVMDSLTRFFGLTRSMR
jgi:hypothetical protein